MPVTLKPLGDRVVVKPKPKDEMTSSGIVLPDTASEKPQEGSVLSVGPGRVLDSGKRVEMDVQVGDSVLFAKYAGTVHLDDDLVRSRVEVTVDASSIDTGTADRDTRLLILHPAVARRAWTGNPILRAGLRYRRKGSERSPGIQRQ